MEIPQIPDALLKQIKEGNFGSRKLTKSNKSYYVSVPKYLFRFEQWKEDDRVNVVIMPHQALIIVHNPNAEERQKKLKVKGV